MCKKLVILQSVFGVGNIKQEWAIKREQDQFATPVNVLFKPHSNKTSTTFNGPVYGIFCSFLGRTNMATYCSMHDRFEIHGAIVYVEIRRASFSRGILV